MSTTIYDLYESQQATQQQVSSILTIAIVTLPVVLLNNQSNHKGSAIGRRFFKRKRKQVATIYKELGDIYFRRAYRMSYCTFKQLASMLSPLITAYSGIKIDSTNNVPNGRITPEVRLACALRWFSGGSVYDIMTTYGISHTETINSVWYAVDAANYHSSFKLVYPEEHSKQQEIADK
jgi:hypothetical protein